MANGCPNGEHWDNGAQSCVPNGTEQIEALSSQVTYAALRRVVGHSTQAEIDYRLSSTKEILEKALKKLNARVRYPTAKAKAQP